MVYPDSEDYMSTIAFDSFALTRIADFARSLSRLHQASRRQPIDDDQIELPVADGAGQMLEDGGASGLADHVADEKNSQLAAPEIECVLFR